MEPLIENSENVARILRKDWFYNGKLMHIAFALRNGESYISVNRLSIETFDDDVRNFVSNHVDCVFGVNPLECCCANLNVGDVRNIRVTLETKIVDIDVEVEPRDIRVKSHAGIFTRYDKINLKEGKSIQTNGTSDSISVDAILLKVRLQLLHKTQCQKMVLSRCC